MSLLCFKFNYVVRRKTMLQNSKLEKIPTYNQVGIYKGDIPTRPKQQSKQGDGNTPQPQTSITSHYNNIRLEPKQFANNFDIIDGDLITEIFGVGRTFLVKTHSMAYKPQCPKNEVWYYKLQCTQQESLAYDND